MGQADFALTTSEVLVLLGYSDSARQGWLRRMIRRGEFPPPLFQGGGRGEENLWDKQLVLAWLAARAGGDRLEVEGVIFLSEDELCEQFGRSIVTLRRWMREEKLPAPDFRFRSRQRLRQYWKLERLKTVGFSVD